MGQLAACWVPRRVWDECCGALLGRSGNEARCAPTVAVECGRARRRCAASHCSGECERTRCDVATWESPSCRRS
eukprot:468500-Pleurochrysis_carterae.AAC.1